MSDSSLFVDSSERVIISDLLYFISNKFRNSTVKDIVTSCHSFYADDDYVFNEKKKLCDATGEICTARRNDKKRLSNIEDICAIFTRRDSQNLFIPKFASLDLNNVPLEEVGNPTLGQLLAAITELKRNVVTTDMLATSLNDFKADLCASATLPVPSAKPKTPSAPPLELVSSPAITKPSYSELVAVHGGGDGGDGSGGDGGGGGGEGGSGGGERAGWTTIEGRKSKTAPRPSTNLRMGANRKPRDASRPRTIIGRNVSDGLLSIKGADLTVNKYISRFHMDTTEETLRQFISQKDVTVVELEPIKTAHERYKSFRLRVKRSDLEKVEDADFWPQGVVVCRYFRPRRKDQSGVVGVVAVTQGPENGNQQG